jgi:hypothetical protein
VKVRLILAEWMLFSQFFEAFGVKQVVGSIEIYLQNIVCKGFRKIRAKKDSMTHTKSYGAVLHPIIAVAKGVVDNLLSQFL